MPMAIPGVEYEIYRVANLTYKSLIALPLNLLKIRFGSKSLWSKERRGLFRYQVFVRKFKILLIDIDINLEIVHSF